MLEVLGPEALYFVGDGRQIVIIVPQEPWDGNPKGDPRVYWSKNGLSFLGLTPEDQALRLLDGLPVGPQVFYTDIFSRRHRFLTGELIGVGGYAFSLDGALFVPVSKKINVLTREEEFGYLLNRARN